ncbi:Uncharacterized protein APZ42_007361, partial [Daphnia magna]
SLYNQPIISSKTSLGIAGFALDLGILGQELPERDIFANSSSWYRASSMMETPFFLDFF